MPPALLGRGPWDPVVSDLFTQFSAALAVHLVYDRVDRAARAHWTREQGVQWLRGETPRHVNISARDTPLPHRLDDPDLETDEEDDGQISSGGHSSNLDLDFPEDWDFLHRAKQDFVELALWCARRQLRQAQRRLLTLANLLVALDGTTRGVATLSILRTFGRQPLRTHAALAAPDLEWELRCTSHWGHPPAARGAC